jgi:hypothetical protein
MATRHDETAAAFLDAGSALIDAMLEADRSGPLPARLRQLHYPAPLEWIRIEDVLRIVGGSAQTGRKAFYNRWPTKDDYIRDCFIHTLLYRDRDGEPLADIAMLQAHLTDTGLPLPVRVRNVAWGIAAGLLNDPRASLLSNAAVMVHHDPETAEVVIEASARERETWHAAYEAVLDGAGLVLRPGWTIDGLIVIVQMLIDGTLRHERGSDAQILVDHQVIDNTWTRVPQIGPANVHATHVFVSVSGNNMDFGYIMENCFQACQGTIDQARPKISAATKGLTKAIKMIHANAPQAQIILTGYAPLVGIYSYWGRTPRC